jgi:hypothetical protein
MFPPEPFHRWTADNAYDTTHYWSAYPDATTRDVGRALRVQATFDRLPTPTATTTPSEFDGAWQAFLAEAHADL